MNLNVDGKSHWKVNTVVLTYGFWNRNAWKFIYVNNINHSHVSTRFRVWNCINYGVDYNYYLPQTNLQYGNFLHLCWLGLKRIFVLLAPISWNRTFFSDIPLFLSRNGYAFLGFVIQCKQTKTLLLICDRSWFEARKERWWFLIPSKNSTIGLHTITP